MKKIKYQQNINKAIAEKKGKEVNYVVNRYPFTFIQFFVLSPVIFSAN